MMLLGCGRCTSVSAGISGVSVTRVRDAEILRPLVVESLSIACDTAGLWVMHRCVNQWTFESIHDEKH